MKKNLFAIIAGVILLSPLYANARPISDDVEELNLKHDLAFAEIGENAEKNFAFEIIEGTAGKTSFVTGQIKHLKSGLVCEFNANEEINIKVFNQDQNGQIDDFSCSIDGYGYNKTFYGYLKKAPIEQELLGSKIAIEYRFPNAINYEIPVSDYSIGTPKIDVSTHDYFKNSKSAAYDVDINGAHLISSVWIYDNKDWYYKMRFSITKEKNRESISEWFKLLNLSLAQQTQGIGN